MKNDLQINTVYGLLNTGTSQALHITHQIQYQLYLKSNKIQQNKITMNILH